MEQLDLLRHVVETLEQLSIPYMIVGSFASSIYGEPRMTQDIDVVVDPSPPQLEALCAAFGTDDYYVSLDAARDALARRDQFNVIHPESKQDRLHDRPATAWGREQVDRRTVVGILPDRAYVARPEDVILSKLRYYQQGGSEKHLRDIAGVLKGSPDLIDRDYINRWARELDVEAEWAAVLARMG